MRSFNTAFNTERAKRGTAPVNVVEFGFDTPLLAADRDMIIGTPQDFSTYEEVDIPREGCIYVNPNTPNQINISYMRLNETAYLYKDFGAGFFGGAVDFTHALAIRIGNTFGMADGAKCCVWGLGNSVGVLPVQSSYLALEAEFDYTTGTFTLWLTAKGATWSYTDSATGLAKATGFFLTMAYDASAAQLSCAIYSDEARTILVDTLTVCMDAALSWQYLYGTSTSTGSGSPEMQYAKIWDLVIEPLITPSGLVTDWSYVDSATDTARDLMAPVTAPDLELSLANTGSPSFSSLFDDEPPESVPVTVHQYFKGLPWANAEIIFQGYVREVMEYDSMTCKLLIQGLWARYDRMIGQAVTTDDFPNADPDVIGKMQPVVYGAVDNLPCLAVEAGGLSPLVADITKTATSIEVSDASAFPTSGTIQIDSEKITYTGKSTNTLTGCTRGASSTTATTHDAGAKAAQVLTSFVYLAAGHPVKSIGDVYVEGVRQTSGVTKYTGQTGDALSGYEGLAVIVFSALPLVKRQINAEDLTFAHSHAFSNTLDVTDNIGVSSAPTTMNIYPSSASSSNMKDGSAVTYYELGTSSVSASFPSPSPSPGTITTQCVHFTAGSVGAKTLNIGGGWSPSSVTTGETSEFRVAKSGGAWNDGISFSGEGVRINEVWRKEVLYTPTLTKSGAAYDTGAVSSSGSASLTGNATADTVIGGQVTADVEGYQDDASGTYTGTASALIQRPDHVFKHLLCAVLGVDSGDLDATAFSAAGTFFNTNSYVFALALTQTEQAASLLARLAFQCRSYFRFTPYGKARLLVRQLSQTSAKALGVSAIKLDSLSIARTSTDLLVNTFTLHFDKDQTKAGAAAGDFLGATDFTDSTSVSTYGERTPAREADFYCDAVRDSDMAAHVGAFHLAWLKRPRKMPGLALFLDNLEIEPGDAVDISHPLDSMAGFTVEILKTTHRLGSARRKAMDSVELLTIDNGA